MHSMAFICYVFNGKDLSLHVYGKILSRAHLYSIIVFEYAILIPRKDKYNLGKIGLYFWRFGEKLNYFLGFGERRQIL